MLSISRQEVTLGNSYLVTPLDFDAFTALMSEPGYYWLAWNINPWSEDSQF